MTEDDGLRYRIVYADGHSSGAASWKFTLCRIRQVKQLGPAWRPVRVEVAATSPRFYRGRR